MKTLTALAASRLACAPIRAFFAITVFAFGANVGSAQGETLRNFHVAGWFAGAYSFEGTRTFSHCAASAQYNSGTFVVFSITRAYAWSMGLANPKWQLTKDREYNIAFSIDASTPIYVKAKAVNANQVRMDLADSGELFRQFQRGYSLQITSANNVFHFNLDGTSAMLQALLNCVGQETNPTGSNPFVAQQTPTGRPASRGAFQAEAAILGANVLGGSGINGFSFGSPENAAKFKADALWTSDALVGTIKIVEGVKLDNPEIPSILIGEDAKTCKGAFLSGSLPDSDGSAMLRIFTSCQEAKKTLTVYYLAVPRPKGGIYLFATFSNASQEAVKEADSGLHAAVFRAIR